MNVAINCNKGGRQMRLTNDRMRIGDTVRVLPVEPVAPVWHGREGVVLGVYGEMKPFHWEIEIKTSEKKFNLLFRGDEIERIRDR